MTAGCILSGYGIHTTGFPATYLTFACITAFVIILFLALQFYMFLKRDNQEFDDGEIFVYNGVKDGGNLMRDEEFH